MRIRSSLLLVLPLLAGGFARADLALDAQERAFVDAHPVLRVAMDPAYPPFEMEIDDQPTGFSPDYLRALAALIGVELEFVYSDWSGMLDLAKTRKVDIVSGVFRGGEQDAFLLYTEPYLRLVDGIFVRRGSPPLADWRALAGKRVAIVRDYEYERLIVDHHPEIEMVLVENALDGLTALSLGKVDAYLENAAVAYYLTTTHFISNVELVGRPQFPESQDGGDLFFLGVRKDYPLLRDLLDNAMRAYPAAEKQRLHRRWLQHAVDVEREPAARLAAQERTYLDRLGTLDLCIVSPPGDATSDAPDATADLARDLGSALGRSLGVAVRRQDVATWSEALWRVGTQRCDLMPLAVLSPWMADEVAFSQPFAEKTLVVATRVSDPFIWSRSGLAGRRLGVVAGSMHEAFVAEIYPELRTEPVATAAEGLRQVRDGELFGLIDSLMVISQQIHKGGAEDMKIAGALDTELSLAAATPIGAPLLGSAAAKALDAIGQREIDRLIGQWQAAEVRQPVDYGRIWELAGVAVLLLLLLMAWNRSLMRSNRALADAKQALAEKSAMLERMSITDALTGVGNRRRLDQALAAEIDRCRRGGAPFSLLLFDIDRFKLVNDRFGHLVGDKVLKTFSERLSALSRTPDLLGRWGGEEFLLLCPNTSAEPARELAERLRLEVAAILFGPVGRCTCSIGVTTYADADDANAVLRRADRALYLAKERGRNQVVLLQDDQATAQRSDHPKKGS